MPDAPLKFTAEAEIRPQAAGGSYLDFETVHAILDQTLDAVRGIESIKPTQVAETHESIGPTPDSI